MHALEKEKLLISYWEEVDGRKRKYYHLTDKGARQFKEKKDEFVSYVDRVIEQMGEPDTTSQQISLKAKKYLLFQVS